MIKEVPARMFHNACGSVVFGDVRTVLSEPRDKKWPHDTFAMVPFCTGCKAIVDFTSVTISRVPNSS